MGKAEQELFSEELRAIVPKGRLLEKEPLKRHTTFRVGGAADWFVYADSEEVLRRVLLLCREAGQPYEILGNGSNLLVSDHGYRGVIVRLSGEFEELTFSEEWTKGLCRVTAGAGVLLSRLSAGAGKKGFTGLEFANGIPGTVGGGVLMNAGAYGGEIKDTLRSVDLMTPDGETRECPAEELALSYRHSALLESRDVVLRARFELRVRQKLQIYAVMESYRKARMEKQPLEYPSAGSTFRRPEGHFAGKLIEEAGLSGARIGDAQVSEKHAGFIINRGNATAQDIYRLIRHVQREVLEKSQVELTPEVRFLGEF